MNPFLSWGILLVVIGSYLFYDRYTKNAAAAAQKAKVEAAKASIFITGTEEKKKKKNKKATPAKRPAPSTTASTTKEKEASTQSDNDDVAVEEDVKEMAKQLALMRAGKPVVQPEEPKKKKARTLAPSSPFSGTSSTGADGDEESLTDYAAAGRSDDPSDMLEGPSGGPRVMKLTPSQQPARAPKQKKESNAPSVGTQHSKNQKKKEKAKAAKEAERAAQQAAREKYRQEQKAEQAAAERKKFLGDVGNGVFKPQANSAWTGTGKAPEASKKSYENEPLLDVFGSSTSGTTSDDGKVSRIDGSVWEDVPSNIMQESEWNTVTKKKPAKKEKTIPGIDPLPAASTVTGNSRNTSSNDDAGAWGSVLRNAGIDPLPAPATAGSSNVDDWNTVTKKKPVRKNISGIEPLPPAAPAARNTSSTSLRTTTSRSFGTKSGYEALGASSASDWDKVDWEPATGELTNDDTDGW